MSGKKRLDKACGFRLIYDDQTRFGSAISGACQETVRRLCAPVVEYRREHGLGPVVADARRLLGLAYEKGLTQIASGPGVLSPEWLYPRAELTRPVALQIERDVGVAVARIELSSKLGSNLAAYLGDWEAGCGPPEAGPARELWEALAGLRVLVDCGDPAPYSQYSAEATLVGHACVKLSDGHGSVLVDPYLLPKSAVYPSEFQPTAASELGRIDAILITHGHPDHFDPGTLLRFGAGTPIFVPAVDRESVLSVDIGMRLEELGFRDVRRLAWHEEASIGQIRVIALPFFGEQPTTGEVLHPEVRMLGNTYLVELAGRRIAMTVDSGRDHLGDIHELARDSAERYGPIDVLFGGYRGFGLYPVQYVFSSVSSYLTFVPEAHWAVRQRIMCDADEFMDVAELWQARVAVPYAGGGAPWYWMRGLGPCLDNSATMIDATDPTPDYVRDVATRRSGSPKDGLVASPVPVSLLRPGDSIRLDGDDLSVRPNMPWPY